MSNRAPDFRWYPANALGFAFSDNDARITFGVEEPGETEAYEQAGVVMSHRTLKLLGAMIQQTIQHYETHSGVTVQLDPEKIEMLKQNLITPEKPNASARLSEQSQLAAPDSSSLPEPSPPSSPKKRRRS